MLRPAARDGHMHSHAGCDALRPTDPSVSLASRGSQAAGLHSPGCVPASSARPHFDISRHSRRWMPACASATAPLTPSDVPAEVPVGAELGWPANFEERYMLGRLLGVYVVAHGVFHSKRAHNNAV